MATLGPANPRNQRTGAQMESSQRKQLVEQLERRLIQELVEMRNRQTHLSLMLKDLQFETDVAQRQAAAGMAADCIARSQSRHN